MIEEYHKIENKSKGCILLGLIMFLINSVIVSLVLIFGGDIYEKKSYFQSGTGDHIEYTNVENLKISFFILVLAVIIFAYTQWQINKRKKAEE